MIVSKCLQCIFPDLPRRWKESGFPFRIKGLPRNIHVGLAMVILIFYFSNKDGFSCIYGQTFFS